MFYLYFITIIRIKTLIDLNIKTFDIFLLFSIEIFD